MLSTDERAKKDLAVRSLGNLIALLKDDGSRSDICEEYQEILSTLYRVKDAREALMIFLQDTSGSMVGTREIIQHKAVSFELEMARDYHSVEKQFINYGGEAEIVGRHAFLAGPSKAGGTLISSAYEACLDLLRLSAKKDVHQDVYVYQFSDGDSWSSDDTAKCIRMLDKDILPRVTLFHYVQVKSRYGGGNYLSDLQNSLVVNNRRLVRSYYTSLASALGLDEDPKEG